MSQTWRLGRTEQCAKCPWRVDVNPRQIPNGYCEVKHAALKSTIAKPCDLQALFSGQPERAMACHESHQDYCIGWLNHQLGVGNNLSLRMRMRSCENAEAIVLHGEQHDSFEKTLPRKRKRKLT